MNDIIKPQQPKDAFERLEKFQSLSAGQFWRALMGIPKYAIQQDMVLLIESIAWVDNQPHTISVRAHPDQYGQHVKVEWTDEQGQNRQGYVTCETHEFRISSFLQKFEFEPAHEQIRQRELAAAQGRVFALQQDLVDTQSSPEKMAKLIAAGLEESARKSANSNPAGQLPIAIDHTARVPQNLSSFLSSGITESSIAVMKAQAERSHAIATIQGNWITTKTKEIEQAIKRMTPYFDEYGAAALAHTEEVRVYVDKIMAGIKSLDLYIGKDVEVTTLRKGASACSSNPLTIMQRKLIMVEEIAVFTHVDESSDHRDFKGMSLLLGSNPEFVAQIFPTERCIVCMCSTRRDVYYENTYESLQRNRTNHEVFLLVRDGENIHCVDSPVTTHLGASRLFPSKNEIDGLFTGVGGEQITFDSLKYTKSLSAFEAQSLHYKRFLILMAGLDHRLQLFGQFYSEPQGLDFVTLPFQEKYLRFIHDEDGESMLPRERLQHVSKWIEEMNSYLAPGSRVFCLWWRLRDEEASPGLHHFKADPVRRRGIALAYGDGNDICVDVDAKRSSWHDNQNVFQSKVFLTRTGSLTPGAEPYLVLDAVQPDQLRRYIYDRESRVHSVEYIELFKQTLKFVQQERAFEEPMRSRMRQALIEGGISGESEADTLVDKAVIRWRAANKGASLPRFQGSTPPEEWSVLLNLLFMLQHGSAARQHAIGSFAQDRCYSPLRLVLTGKSQLVLYAAPSTAERDDRVCPFVWVHRIVLRVGKRSIGELSRKWVLLQKKSAAELVQYEWPESKEWESLESPFKSPQAKVDVFNQLTLNADLFNEILGSENAFAEVSKAWRREHRLSNAGPQRTIYRPSFFLPIGLIGRGSTLNYLGFGCQNGAFALANCSAAPEMWAEVVSEYLRLNNSAHIDNELRSHRNGRRDLSVFRIHEMPVTSSPHCSLPLFLGRNSPQEHQEAQPRTSVANPVSFDQRLRALYPKDDTGRSRLVWIAPPLRAGGESSEDSSNVRVDEWLGLEKVLATVAMKTIVTVTFRSEDASFPYKRMMWAFDGKVDTSSASLYDFKGWSGASTCHEFYRYQDEYDAALQKLKHQAIPMDNAPPEYPQPKRPDKLLACLYVPV
ncbi:hypothetical protein BLL42_27455 (plasmid) [Pseudomonas frederiksbergensis]|uniref:Uncharacterized protein n=1 Tax=Pseudomonas frederiksbergensis TaxID=104087 RepID=A0A1J0ETJ5_9PSED|nr:hypothetical protein [Pseudomonas frederiksbergensis]APC19474.1 hypothetical protein BLL42_27455 [Pseudomonas frederiksbergensis]